MRTVGISWVNSQRWQRREDTVSVKWSNESYNCATNPVTNQKSVYKSCTPPNMWQYVKWLFRLVIQDFIRNKDSKQETQIVRHSEMVILNVVFSIYLSIPLIHNRTITLTSGYGISHRHVIKCHRNMLIQQGSSLQWG
jgi:hypothetical protein